MICKPPATIQASVGSITGGNGGNIAQQTITNYNIANQTIQAAQIANQTITNTQIANNTITASQIQNNTITNAQIANNTIGSGQMNSGYCNGTFTIVCGTISCSGGNISYQAMTMTITNGVITSCSSCA